MSFWTRNLETKGRVVRIVAGLAMIAGAVPFIRPCWYVLAGVLLASGGFVLFEGLRGWCVVRACKIKTPF